MPSLSLFGSGNTSDYLAIHTCMYVYKYKLGHTFLSHVIPIFSINLRGNRANAISITCSKQYRYMRTKQVAQEGPVFINSRQLLVPSKHPYLSGHEAFYWVGQHNDQSKEESGSIGHRIKTTIVVQKVTFKK